MREGGKGLFYGWWDGITGLATEPIAGAQKEVSAFLCGIVSTDARYQGPAGFAKGALRSCKPPVYHLSTLPTLRECLTLA